MAFPPFDFPVGHGPAADLDCDRSAWCPALEPARLWHRGSVRKIAIFRYIRTEIPHSQTIAGFVAQPLPRPIGVNHAGKSHILLKSSIVGRI